jgi:hypothetical protein
MLTQDERQYVTLVVTKGRFCASGAAVDLHFDGATMSFTQIDDDYAAKRKDLSGYKCV